MRDTNVISKNITVNIFESQVEWLRKASYLRKTSRNDLLREILTYYIEKKGEKYGNND